MLPARADVMATLDVPKVAPASNDIPERLETGTQNHEGIVGSGAAVEFLASLAPGAGSTASGDHQRLTSIRPSSKTRVWAGGSRKTSV